MLQKSNLTFVTLKIKVITPKLIGFCRGLWGSYIPGFKLIAVKLFELSQGNGLYGQTDRQKDRQHHSIIRPSCDGRIINENNSHVKEITEFVGIPMRAHSLLVFFHEKNWHPSTFIQYFISAH